MRFSKLAFKKHNEDMKHAPSEEPDFWLPRNHFLDFLYLIIPIINFLFIAKAFSLHSFLKPLLLLGTVSQGLPKAAWSFGVRGKRGAEGHP